MTVYLETFTFADGTHSYSTTVYLPDVEKSMEMRGQVTPLLSGGSFLTIQSDSNSLPVVPDVITLKWPQYAPETLIAYVEEAFRAGRQVTITYPWRGAQGTITGYILPNGYKVQQRRGKTYSMEITVQAVSIA